MLHFLVALTCAVKVRPKLHNYEVHSLALPVFWLIAVFDFGL